jgi:hypothetical protein
VKKSPAPPFIPEPDRPIKMPFDDFHLRLEEAIGKLKVPRIRHACRSAFNHLRKAWVLHPVDSEMSSFRAITAEEEAATAVIRALRHQSYPNAENLSDRNHVHKSALWPFIGAVSDKMVEKNIIAPTVSLQVKGDPRIELLFDIGSRGGLDRPLWGRPNEPFNFSMWSDRTGPFKLHDFSEELMTLATDEGLHNIEAYVKAEANKRNRLLYASEQGIPSAMFADSYLIARRDRVIVLIVLTIAILQTTTHQLFLVQCLDALLRAVQRFEGDPLELPRIDRTVPRFELIEQSDGSMKLSHVRPITTLKFRYTIVPKG